MSKIIVPTNQAKAAAAFDPEIKANAISVPDYVQQQGIGYDILGIDPKNAEQYTVIDLSAVRTENKQRIKEGFQMAVSIPALALLFDNFGRMYGYSTRYLLQGGLVGLAGSTLVAVKNGILDPLIRSIFLSDRKSVSDS